MKIANQMIVLAVFLLFTSGCQTIATKSPQIVEQNNLPKELFIDVGGIVHKPGRIPVTANSTTTLRRALALAGGPRQEGMVHKSIVLPLNDKLVNEIENLRRTATKWGTLRGRLGDSPSEKELELLEIAEERMNAAESELSENEYIVENALEPFVANFHVKTRNVAKYSAYREIVSRDSFVGAKREEFLKEREWEVLDDAGIRKLILDQLDEDSRSARVSYESIIANSGTEKNSSVVTSRSTVLLVAIESKQFGQNRYFVPYSLVEQNLFGEIVLESGALINVTSFENTSLRTMKLSGAGETFSVSGLVRNPGLRKLTSVNIGALMVATPNEGPPVTLLQPNSTANVWALTRAQPTGIGADVFLLPNEWFGEGQPLEKARVLNGDQFQVLYQAQVPIVTRSLVRQALVPAADLQRKIDSVSNQNIRQSNVFRNSYRQQGPTRARSSLREFGQQTRLRFGF